MSWSAFFKTLVSCLLIAWVGGFFLYLYQIHHFKETHPLTEGIVILTGGKGRIKKGIQLKEITTSPPYEGHIDLGFNATTTRENAKEVSDWNKEKSCSSLTVVTSHYHIPRSLLELKAALPHIILIPYPIISPSFQNRRWLSEPDLWQLLFKEYNKYLIVFLEMRIRSFLK